MVQALVSVYMLVGDCVCICTTHEQYVVYCVNVLIDIHHMMCVWSEELSLGTKLKPCIEVFRIHPFLGNRYSQNPHSASLVC